MTDQSNRKNPAPPTRTDGRNDTATGRGPQRQDDEPQVPPAASPAAAPATNGKSKRK